MSPRLGRPTKCPKTTEIKVRATEQDKKKLKLCCEATGKTQYEVVMAGINKVYDEIKK